MDETVYPNITKDACVVKEVKEKKRGMSDQKINVTCANDSTGCTVVKVTDIGRITAQSLIVYLWWTHLRKKQSYL